MNPTDQDATPGEAPQTPPAPAAVRWPSCGRLMSYAIVLSALFAIVHMAGFRQHTAVLSGTVPADWRAFGGGVYILLYMAFVFVVPVLVIASALLAGWGLLWSRMAKPRPRVS